MGMTQSWCSANTRRFRNAFGFEREVISVIKAGVLLISFAGFWFTGVLVDQIEAFFTENRREEPETEETLERKELETGQKRAS